MLATALIAGTVVSVKIFETRNQEKQERMQKEREKQEEKKEKEQAAMYEEWSSKIKEAEDIEAQLIEQISSINDFE